MVTDKDGGEEIEDDIDGGDDGDFGDDFGDDEIEIEADDDSDFGDDGFDDEEEEEPVRARPKRRPARKKEPEIEGVPRKKLDKPEVIAEVWQKLRKRRGDGDAIPWSLTAKLQLDDVVTHSKFGVGYVIGMPAVQKAEILFEDAVRKLVCNR